MGLMKKIFGNDEERGKVVDAAIGGLDKMFFTKEERSQASQKLNDWYLDYLKASSPQNLARRLIAIMVTALWGLILIVAVILYPISKDWSEVAFKALDEIVNQPFSIIIGFYFLTHLTRQFQKPKKGDSNAS